MAEKKFKLVEFSKEEVEALTKELEVLLEKYSGHFVASPIINRDGTIGAIMQVLKKQEIEEEVLQTNTKAEKVS